MNQNAFEHLSSQWNCFHILSSSPHCLIADTALQPKESCKQFIRHRFLLLLSFFNSFLCVCVSMRFVITPLTKILSTIKKCVSKSLDLLWHHAHWIPIENAPMIYFIYINLHAHDHFRMNVCLSKARKISSDRVPVLKNENEIFDTWRGDHKYNFFFHLFILFYENRNKRAKNKRKSKLNTHNATTH